MNDSIINLRVLNTRGSVFGCVIFFPFFLNTCINLLDKQQIEEIIGVDLTHSVLRFNCKANDGLIQTTDQETSIPEQLRRKYHD